RFLHSTSLCTIRVCSYVKVFWCNSDCDTAGSPLALDDLPSVFVIPLLSQGDHPTLGTPCWYLHPCQSA
ncbi:hypothetical protein L208DRAFT_1398182, partial [Tricholoma matsutake]